MVKVALADLVLDYELYPRVRLSDMYVAELAEALRSGVVLPPVVVDRASNRVVDGFHRVKAHCGFSSPPPESRRSGRNMRVRPNCSLMRFASMDNMAADSARLTTSAVSRSPGGMDSR